MTRTRLDSTSLRSLRATIGVAAAPALTVVLLLGGGIAAAQQGAPNVPSVPATSLVQPESRARPPDADGFLQRWLILEPIAVDARLTDSAVQATVKREYFPGQFTAVPRDGDSVTVGDQTLGWHAVDTLNYNVNLFHFARSLGRPTSNVLFWAVTVIEVPEEMREVRLAIGSNAASIWWVNGEEVIGIYNDRQSVIDDGVSDRLTLRRGRNVIRAAIVNAGGATDFCARLLDAANQPIIGISLTP
jgi:hypothetical protein